MKGFATINQKEILGINRLTNEYYDYFSMFDVKALTSDGEFLILTFENTTFEIRYDLHLQRIEYVMYDGDVYCIVNNRDRVLSESSQDLIIDDVLIREQYVEISGNNEAYRFHYDFDVKRTLDSIHEGGIVTGTYYEYKIENLRITKIEREVNSDETIMVNFYLTTAQKVLILETINNVLYNHYNEIN